MGTSERLRLDTEAGIRISGGSKETYFSILSLTEKYAEEKLSSVEKVYGNREWEQYEIEVHSLKSAMASIGAFSLSELAKSHELAAKDGNLSYIEETFSKLKEEARIVLLEIQDYLAKQEISEMESLVDEKDYKEALQSILDLVREFDFGAAMDELERIKEELKESDFRSACVNGIEALENFDGESAITELEKWV